CWTQLMAAQLLRFKRTLVIPNNYWFQVIARLKDGVSPSQAQSEMRTVTKEIEQKYPAPTQTQTESARGVTLAPLQYSKLDPAIKKSFLILLVAVALVFLFACAHIANPLLSRAAPTPEEVHLRA